MVGRRRPRARHRLRYRWESDGRIGPVAEFRTPPATVGSFSFGVIGDFGIATPAAHANLRRLAADPIDFAITTGDNAQIFGNEEEYRNFVLGPLAGFIAQRPFWPSVGNHDYYSLANYRRYFALPGNERYYSFTYGGVLFLALDSNRFDAAQQSWARRKLGASQARCKVAYFHHPLWSSGRGYRSHVRHSAPAEDRPHPGAGRRRPGAQRPRAELRALEAARSGPAQPARHRLRRDRGGGARLNRFATRRRPRWSARRGMFYHRLHVTATNQRLKVKAIDTGGRTRDRFTVHCRPG